MNLPPKPISCPILGAVSCFPDAKNRGGRVDKWAEMMKKSRMLVKKYIRDRFVYPGREPIGNPRNRP